MALKHIKTKIKTPLYKVLIAFAVIAVYRIIDPSVFGMEGGEATSYFYGALVLIWGLSIVHRVVQKNALAILFTGGVLVWSLFVIRLCKWIFFSYSNDLGRLFWYLMYIPFLSIPLLCFYTALSTGKRDEDKPLKGYLWLSAVCVILIILTLTNDFTGAVFIIESMEGSRDVYHYSILYYFFFAWEISLTLAAFITLMRRCSLSASRKKWYVPGGLFLFGFVLFMIYIVIGGSPEINGTVLYTIQEIWAFLFVTLWEGCIYIGLFPANSDYTALFSSSHTGAAILDSEGNVVYASSDYKGTEASGDDSTVLRTGSIRGGSVIWTEDHSAINRANETLETLTEEILAENEILEEENRIAKETAAYEERNRLYDAIAGTLKPTFDKLRILLDDETGTTNEKERLIASAVLGVYIKRSANLTLLADRQEHISSTELMLSIRESFEYLALAGCACEINEVNYAEVPSSFCLMAFDVYEAIAEASVRPFGACFVKIEAVPAFRVTVETDIREGIEEVFNSKKKEIVNAGLELSFLTRDDTTVFTIEERGMRNEFVTSF